MCVYHVHHLGVKSFVHDFDSQNGGQDRRGWVRCALCKRSIWGLLNLHPLWFWMNDKLCQPSIWCHAAKWSYSTQSTLLLYDHLIHCGFEWMINYASLQYDIMLSKPTQYTVKPLTVWPLNLIHCDFEWMINFISLQYDIMLPNHTQLHT